MSDAREATMQSCRRRLVACHLGLSTALLFVPTSVRAQNPFPVGSVPSLSDGHDRAEPSTTIAAATWNLRGAYAAPVAVARPIFKLQTPASLPSPGLIEHMQSSFRCYDTPFLSQVRLPIVTIWGGRLKLGGFQSQSHLPMSYFQWGLPGAGAVRGVGLAGGGRFGVLTPPEDDSYGLQLAVNLQGGQLKEGDSSGWHGMKRALRASRELFRH